MINLKTTILAVIALNTGAAFAGNMGPVCTTGIVPCANTGWGIGVQALYLRPSYSDKLSWAGTNSNTTGSLTIGTTSTTIETDTYVENKPDWSWGFKLESSYHFHTGNDLNLNWYHLGHKIATNYTTTNSTEFNTTQTVPSPITATISDAVSIQPIWDAVNLEFGKHVDVSTRQKIRFHGGVQYAYVKTNLPSFINGIDFVSTTQPPRLGPTTTHESDTAKFNGVGPRIGSDMSYDLNRGFAVYANGAATILAGTSQFTTFSTKNSTIPTGPINTFYIVSTNGKKTSLVPELEAKLGLSYSYVMSRGNLTVDGGYMWLNYFRAQTINGQDSNFGIDGAFLELKWLSNN